MGPKPMTHKPTGEEQKVSFNEIKLITTVAEIQIQKNKATAQGRPRQKTNLEDPRNENKSSTKVQMKSKVWIKDKGTNQELL